MEKVRQKNEWKNYSAQLAFCKINLKHHSSVMMVVFYDEHDAIFCNWIKADSDQHPKLKLFIYLVVGSLDLLLGQWMAHYATDLSWSFLRFLSHLLIYLQLNDNQCNQIIILLCTVCMSIRLQVDSSTICCVMKTNR